LQVSQIVLGKNVGEITAEDLANNWKTQKTCAKTHILLNKLNFRKLHTGKFFEISNVKAANSIP